MLNAMGKNLQTLSRFLVGRGSNRGFKKAIGSITGRSK